MNFDASKNNPDNNHSEASTSPAHVGAVRKRQRPSSGNPARARTQPRSRPRQAKPADENQPAVDKSTATSKLLFPKKGQERARGAPKPGRDYKPLVHAKNGRKLDELDYEQGYGKPPEKSKFKKGKSGNPKGRPKGSKGLKNILKDVLDQKIVSRTNGSEKKITTREGIIMRLIKKALDGDHNAIKLIMAKDEDFQLETLVEEVADAQSQTSTDAVDDAILAEFTRQVLEQSDGDETNADPEQIEE